MPDQYPASCSCHCLVPWSNPRSTHESDDPESMSRLLTRSGKLSSIGNSFRKVRLNWPHFQGNCSALATISHIRMRRSGCRLRNRRYGRAHNRCRPALNGRENSHTGARLHLFAFLIPARYPHSARQYPDATGGMQVPRPLMERPPEANTDARPNPPAGTHGSGGADD